MLQRLRPAVAALHQWFLREGRDLPWRRSRDPYAIWISEVMLQQTQVSTVIPYYQRWLQALPTVSALAQADRDALLRLWEGLGYYSRVRHLQHAAQRLLERHRGEIPNDPQAFGALPGVGPYTVAAVMSIAFNHDLAVIDGNVRRVLSRWIALKEDARRACGAQILQTLAQMLLPPQTAALHNQAMMELGALICLPRSPRCEACPAQQGCQAFAEGHPEDYPLKSSPKAIPHRQQWVALIWDRQGQPPPLLLVRRPYRGFLGGYWELPRVEIEEREPHQDAPLVHRLRQSLGLEVSIEQRLPPVDHAYSHFKLTLHPRLCQLMNQGTGAAEASPPCQWVPPAGLAQVPIARADRKVLERLGRDGCG
jgi:A/G-specific adenine glycosylase